ncbi:hypothetical protein HUT18_31090 [Streptomyces sp. NA04227]|uniref:hypothetical protein n=1 Tax=Streptomyces sp. NA04227 TaxID=2742136 RepID=UPI00159197A5|nr:hypothetical protein [Streptomyces sp. NA04227]QKW10190.1 hypothetical protein HUT18_31090 [Streptomyces sp. NA04227]
MASAAKSTRVGLAVVDGVATITLDGPSNHIALDESTAAALVVDLHAAASGHALLSVGLVRLEACGLG